MTSHFIHFFLFSLLILFRLPVYNKDNNNNINDNNGRNINGNNDNDDHYY